MTRKRYTDRQAADDKAAIMRDLRHIREAYLRGEVDAEGRETAYGTLVRAARLVNVRAPGFGIGTFESKGDEQ